MRRASLHASEQCAREQNLIQYHKAPKGILSHMRQQGFNSSSTAATTSDVMPPACWGCIHCGFRFKSTRCRARHHDRLLPPLQAAGPRPDMRALQDFDEKPWPLHDDCCLALAEIEDKEDIEHSLRETIMGHTASWTTCTRRVCQSQPLVGLFSRLAQFLFAGIFPTPMHIHLIYAYYEHATPTVCWVCYAPCNLP